MSTKNNPHNQAMDLVETAIRERTRGNTERTNQLYAQALELELASIRELEERTDLAEPTWSVLHRSAGWMAFNSNQPRLAEKLACKALAGDPPPGNCRGTAGLAGASPRPDGRGRKSGIANPGLPPAVQAGITPHAARLNTASPGGDSPGAATGLEDLGHEGTGFPPGWWERLTGWVLTRRRSQDVGQLLLWVVPPAAPSKTSGAWSRTKSSGTPKCSTTSQE